MRASFLLLCLAVIATGCAGSGGPDDVLPSEASATGRAKSAVDVVGTPVHVAVKGVACVATTVVAFPVASVATISDDDQLRRDTYRTVGETCGGSWVLGED
jgi:hypothetical protein